MNPRERLRAMIDREPLDRGIFWPEGAWGETRQRWLEEGKAPDHDFGFDGMHGVGIDINYAPAWDTGPIEDEGEHELVRDMYGIIRRIRKDAKNRDVAQYVSFPMSDRASWEELKPRLVADAPDRFPDDWPERAKRLGDSDLPIGFGGGHLCGFFSFLRESFGDEEVYYLFADEPDLVREILDFQVERLSGMLKQVVKDVRVDTLFIWEDMCYKNGPLISPEMFREFLLEPYQRYIAVAKEQGVWAIDVDSDGDCRKLLPLWIEAGVNMQHPLEVQSGMDAVELVNEFGDDLMLRGGIDKRELAKGKDAIDRELDRIRPAYETGSYIPAADHSIPPDVSWENYLYYHEKRKEMVGLG